MSASSTKPFENIKSAENHFSDNLEDENGNNNECTEVNQISTVTSKYSCISVRFNDERRKIVDASDFTTSGIRPLPHFLEYTYKGVDFYQNSKELGIQVLKPVQYNIFKLLTTDFGVPMDKSNIVIETPNGTGKTVGILLTLIEMAMRRTEETDYRVGTPLALIFVHTNLLGTVLKQHLDDLVAGSKIKTAFFASRQREVPRFDFDIGICTAGTFFGLFRQKERNFYNLKFVVIDEADVFFEDLDNIKGIQRLHQLTKSRLIFSSFTFNANNSYLNEKLLNGPKFVISFPPINFIIPKFVEVNCDIRSRIVGISDERVEFKGSANDGQVLNPLDHLYLILKELFEKNDKTSVVVYCKNAQAVDYVARKLWLFGFKAASIHGGQVLELQVPILKAFYEKKLNILIGCRLITRGFDLPVTTVINYHLPTDMPSYLNRCGRIEYLGNKGQIYTFLHLTGPRRNEEYSPAVINGIAKQMKFYVQLHNMDGKMIPPFFLKEIASIFPQNDDIVEDPRSE